MEKIKWRVLDILWKDFSDTSEKLVRTLKPITDDSGETEFLIDNFMVTTTKRFLEFLEEEKVFDKECSPKVKNIFITLGE